MASAVPDSTKEVSLGRDLLGNMDDDYKKEVGAAQATIMSSQEAAGEGSPTTTQHIKAALKELRAKLRKAPGKDRLTNWMLLWAGAATVQPLKMLFTAMWETNTTPDSMKEVLVKYTPNKHSRPSLEISEYRPISLISCLRKLYTMVWLPSLTQKLQPHITKHQGAFQKTVPNA